MRNVTEKDFRKEEFFDAKVEDYEFRVDGKIVRKDRWEMGIRRIKSIILPLEHDFEIEDIIDEVQKLMKNKNKLS